MAKTNNSKSSSVQTAEGRILLFGIVLTLLLAVVTAYFSLADPAKAKTIVLAFIAHTLGGRAAGVGLCIASEFGTFWSIAYNFFLEVIIVAFAYSLFVLSITNSIKLRSVKYFALKATRKARVYKDKIEKYGWIGIFLFVMIPLPVTGPVIGSIIGYLIKMNLWGNLSAVLLGTLSAIVAWVYFFDFLSKYGHVIQYVLIGILILVILSYMKNIISWIRDKKRIL